MGSRSHRMDGSWQTPASTWTTWSSFMPIKILPALQYLPILDYKKKTHEELVQEVWHLWNQVNGLSTSLSMQVAKLKASNMHCTVIHHELVAGEHNSRMSESKSVAVPPKSRATSWHFPKWEQCLMQKKGKTRKGMHWEGEGSPKSSRCPLLECTGCSRYCF